MCVYNHVPSGLLFLLPNNPRLKPRVISDASFLDFQAWPNFIFLKKKESQRDESNITCDFNRRIKSINILSPEGTRLDN